MGNTLVDTFAFNGYPGGPFSPEVVDAAVAYVRNLAGWHIAPVVTETLVVEAPGGSQLILPTRWLVSVSAIRSRSYNDVAGQSVTGWYSYQTAQFRAGVLTHSWGWPYYGALEVDVVHGYDRCPDDLLPTIAQVAADISRNRPIGQVRQESVGAVSVSYDSGSLASFSLGKYMLTGV